MLNKILSAEINLKSLYNKLDLHIRGEISYCIYVLRRQGFCATAEKEVADWFKDLHFYVNEYDNIYFISEV